MSTRKVIVKQPEPPETPIETTVLAKAIVDVSRGMNALLKQGINFKAIVLLCHDNISGTYKPSRTETRMVLESLAELEKAYCRK